LARGRAARFRPAAGFAFVTALALATGWVFAAGARFGAADFAGRFDVSASTSRHSSSLNFTSSAFTFCSS
jgi:hypothetical protein